MIENKSKQAGTLTLDQAMTVIKALVDALEAKDVEARLPVLPNVGLPDVRALSQLPVIGGPGFDAQISDTFCEATFRTRYQPGMPISCYVASNPAFRTAGRTMKPPCFKIGLVSSDRLHQRQLELDRDGYGAMVMHHGELQRDETFGRWDLMRMPSDLMLSPMSPVSVGARDLRITLPKDMSFPEFDARLTAALAPASLTAWTGTKAARLYCERHGIDIAMMRRFTRLRVRDADTAVAGNRAHHLPAENRIAPPRSADRMDHRGLGDVDRRVAAKPSIRQTS